MITNVAKGPPPSKSTKLALMMYCLFELSSQPIFAYPPIVHFREFCVHAMLRSLAGQFYKHGLKLISPDLAPLIKATAPKARGDFNVYEM
jgi:hypothetical protein